jgi:hypothetical protein
MSGERERERERERDSKKKNMNIIPWYNNYFLIYHIFQYSSVHGTANLTKN